MLRGLESGSFPSVLNLFKSSSGAAGIMSYLLKLAANKFLSPDAIYLARFVINIEHCGVGGVKYKNGIACQLEEVAIFRRRFVSALRSFHLLQEKIAKAKAKKTRTAATSFTCQELYRADQAANFSKESRRTAIMKTTTAVAKIIARSFQDLFSWSRSYVSAHS